MMDPPLDTLKDLTLAIHPAQGFHPVVTTLQALLQPVPDPAQMRKRRKRLSAGATAPLEELTHWLVNHGFQHMEAVELPGEFSRRGGILDVFSPDAEAPYRLEFFGDE